MWLQRRGLGQNIAQCQLVLCGGLGRNSALFKRKNKKSHVSILSTQSVNGESL